MTYLETGGYAYVKVAVATVWRQPEAVREKDRPALSYPVDMDGWLAAMTHDDKLDLLGRVDTQCLYGEKVLVKQVVNEWAQIEALSQPGNSGAQSYPGWVPVAQLTRAKELDKADYMEMVVVTSVKAPIYQDPGLQQPALVVSYNTQLPLVDETDSFYQVRTPDGERWVKKSDGERCGQRALTGENLVEEASRFIGLEYLWGGTSAWGFDCSGLAHTIHKRFGKIVPRDAGDQFSYGTPLSREELRTGDLVFFAHDEGKGSIHHVGFYIEGGKLLHAPKTGKSVEIIDLWNHDLFPKEFVGGCRFF